MTKGHEAVFLCAREWSAAQRVMAGVLLVAGDLRGVDVPHRREGGGGDLAVLGRGRLLVSAVAPTAARVQLSASGWKR